MAQFTNYGTDQQYGGWKRPSPFLELYSKEFLRTTNNKAYIVRVVEINGTPSVCMGKYWQTKNGNFVPEKGRQLYMHPAGAELLLRALPDVIDFMDRHYKGASFERQNNSEFLFSPNDEQSMGSKCCGQGTGRVDPWQLSNNAQSVNVHQPPLPTSQTCESGICAAFGNDKPSALAGFNGDGNSREFYYTSNRYNRAAFGGADPIYSKGWPEIGQAINRGACFTQPKSVQFQFEQCDEEHKGDIGGNNAGRRKRGRPQETSVEKEDGDGKAARKKGRAGRPRKRPAADRSSTTCDTDVGASGAD